MDVREILDSEPDARWPPPFVTRKSHARPVDSIQTKCNAASDHIHESAEHDHFVAPGPTFVAERYNSMDNFHRLPYQGSIDASLLEH